MILTTKSVGKSANICWRKNLSKEPDNREMPVSAFAGQIACKIHIDTAYREGKGRTCTPEVGLSIGVATVAVSF